MDTRHTFDTIDQAAKMLSDGSLYIDQIMAGSTMYPSVIIVTCDDCGTRRVMTINAPMPDVLLYLPGCLKAHGWAWM